MNEFSYFYYTSTSLEGLSGVIYLNQMHADLGWSVLERTFKIWRNPNILFHSIDRLFYLIWHMNKSKSHIAKIKPKYGF